jgi:hypothetical protein
MISVRSPMTSVRRLRPYRWRQYDFQSYTDEFGTNPKIYPKINPKLRRTKLIGQFAILSRNEALLRKVTEST